MSAKLAPKLNLTVTLITQIISGRIYLGRPICVTVHSVSDHIRMSSGRKYVQMFASLAANLCQHAVGQCVPMSAYILPQLASDSSQDVLKLSESQGSWFGGIYMMICEAILKLLHQPQSSLSDVSPVPWWADTSASISDDGRV